MLTGKTIILITDFSIQLSLSVILCVLEGTEVEVAVLFFFFFLTETCAAFNQQLQILFLLQLYFSYQDCSMK